MEEVALNVHPPPRVVIVGAGYAGMTTAHRLKGKAELTVVAPTDRFVDRIRLHQFAAGTCREEEVAPSLAEMLPPGVTHVLGTVTAVKPGHVLLDDGRDLSADHVVVAAGSGIGAGVTNLSSSRNLRRQLSQLRAGAVVRIDGAGHTGVELASELAETSPDLKIFLVDPAGVLPRASEPARRRVHRHLESVGVTVDRSQGPRDPDLAIDCTGFATPSIAGLSTPDDTLSFGPGLWLAGDIAGTGHRWSCAAAEPMGAHVADNISRAASGRPAMPFRFGYVVQCVSLGRHQGLVQVVRRDDSARALVIGGAPGAFVKERVSRMARRVASGETKRYRWFSGPSVSEVPRAKEEDAAREFDPRT